MHDVALTWMGDDEESCLRHSDAKLQIGSYIARVTNTVRRAQHMVSRNLRERGRFPSDTRVVLLHSDFHPRTAALLKRPSVLRG